jgi:hypothetical protein
MSARERVAARKRAYNKGGRSFLQGKSIENNSPIRFRCGATVQSGEWVGLPCEIR